MTSPVPSGAEFVAALVQEMERLFGQLDSRETLESESAGRVDVVTLLSQALRSEVEAAEIAGSWMPTTEEMDVKMAFAKQCGDEMRHYELIADRLRQLGHDPEHDAEEAYSPLYQYLRTLDGTVERIAAAPFAREAIAEVRNAQFIDYCRAVGDTDTERLYVDIIQPDEVQHNRSGRALLAKYAVTPELQQAAASATRNSLAIADELRTLAAKTKGLQFVPVS